MTRLVRVWVLILFSFLALKAPSQQSDATKTPGAKKPATAQNPEKPGEAAAKPQTTSDRKSVV